MSNVRKFQYRPSRKKAVFPIEFKTEMGVFRGVCRNVSNTGIRAEFETPLTVGDAGCLVLCHPLRSIEVDARVAYIEETEVGLEFEFGSAWQRGQVLGLLSSPGHSSGTPMAR